MPEVPPPTPYTLPPSLNPLLIVEDNEQIRTQLKWALSRDYEVSVAEDRKSALEAFRSAGSGVVTLDLGLPPHPHGVEEGFHTLSEILQQDPGAKVIVITGRDEREHALRAIGEGAYDFFCKPIQIEELKVVLRRAFHIYDLEREHRELQRCLNTDGFEGMLGASPQMQEVFATIRKVATADVPVLVMGESGTGKELVARAIHRQSSRRDGPFVAINCGAIPENLLESELFGHERGAFTGAHIQRKGRIEMAQNGILFLDEIGELSPALQVKLLRFLQEHQVERVGGRETISVDTRVITATNTDLKQAMSVGRFREDLYYRLGVVVLALPPLRDREGDIPLLAKALLQRYAVESRRKVAGFTPDALSALEGYAWPGNVREMENRIKRAVIMAEGPSIAPGDLELASPYARYDGQRLNKAREELEREMIQRALARHKGHLTNAAAELGVARPTLYEMMEKLGIDKEKGGGSGV
jgi:two-component system NtrC family response regulator